MAFNNEIEKTKKEIEVLTAKLALLEELEKTKSPVEEAYKKVYGVYPTNEITYNSMWGVFQKGYYAAQEDYKVGEIQEPEEQVSFVPKEIKELVKEGVKWCEEHPDTDPLDWLKPQNPEQVADGLKEAFREAVKQGVVSSVDKQENDKNFKNSLDLIKEWGEKNKPPTLYQLIENWWCDVFCANSMDDMETCIDGLVSKIDKQFIPPSHNTNDYQWNKCLKMMRDNLR